MCLCVGGRRVCVFMRPNCSLCISASPCIIDKKNSQTKQRKQILSKAKFTWFWHKLIKLKFTLKFHSKPGQIFLTMLTLNSSSQAN